MNLKKKYDEMLNFMDEVDTILYYVKSRREIIDRFVSFYESNKEIPFYSEGKKGKNPCIVYGDIEYVIDDNGFTFKGGIIPERRDRLDTERYMSINDVFSLGEQFLSFLSEFITQVVQSDAD